MKKFLKSMLIAGLILVPSVCSAASMGVLVGSVKALANSKNDMNRMYAYGDIVTKAAGCDRIDNDTVLKVVQESVITNGIPTNRPLSAAELQVIGKKLNADYVGYSFFLPSRMKVPGLFHTTPVYSGTYYFYVVNVKTGEVEFTDSSFEEGNPKKISIKMEDFYKKVAKDMPILK